MDFYVTVFDWIRTLSAYFKFCVQGQFSIEGWTELINFEEVITCNISRTQSLYTKKKKNEIQGNSFHIFITITICVIDNNVHLGNIE